MYLYLSTMGERNSRQPSAEWTLPGLWHWQRCHDAPWKWRLTAALMPSWSSEVTIFTPVNPLFFKDLKSSDQVVVFSVSATSTATISRLPSGFIAITMRMPCEITRPLILTFS